jgi:4-hydroxy-4-methyl-2-oxoglutarate aldolase
MDRATNLTTTGGAAPTNGPHTAPDVGRGSCATDDRTGSSAARKPPRAATISFAPSCEARLPIDRFNAAAAFDRAVGEDGRGKVLVLASNGHPDTSLGGGTKLSRLDHRGLAGLLADGRLRDFDQLAEYRFTARCRGETTRWGGGDVTPLEAHCPVVFDRVLIMPDDLIYADDSGAVVIPAAEAAAVVSLALEIAGEEVSTRTRIGDEERRRR